ncbi:Protein of unknown function [Bacillus mycoides]|nr:Protein of unknown function [Bacillus mycoides]
MNSIIRPAATTAPPSN